MRWPSALNSLDDGKIRLEVTEHGPSHAITRVVTGGPPDLKGVNVPNATLPLSALSAKDRRIWLSLWILGSMGCSSFVQRPEDGGGAAPDRQTGPDPDQAREAAAIDHLQEL